MKYSAFSQNFTILFFKEHVLLSVCSVLSKLCEFFFSILSQGCGLDQENIES